MGKVIDASGLAIIKKGEYGTIIGLPVITNGPHNVKVTLNGDYDYVQVPMPYLIIVFLRGYDGRPIVADKDIIVDWVVKQKEEGDKMNKKIKAVLEEFFDYVWGHDWKGCMQESGWKNRERWTDEELMEFLTDLAEDISDEVGRR